MKLKVYCSNKNLGCQWIGTIDDYYEVSEENAVDILDPFEILLFTFSKTILDQNKNWETFNNSCSNSTLSSLTVHNNVSATIFVVWNYYQTY